MMVDDGVLTPEGASGLAIWLAGRPCEKAFDVLTRCIGNVDHALLTPCNTSLTELSESAVTSSALTRRVQSLKTERPVREPFALQRPPRSRGRAREAQSRWVA